MSTTRHVVVVLDPSGDPGHAGLEFALDHLGTAGGHITLLSLLGGPTAGPIRDFARAEGITLSEAADGYHARIRHANAGSAVQWGSFATDAADLTSGVLSLVSAAGATASLAAASPGDGPVVDLVVVPAGSALASGDGPERLAREAGLPVVVTPGRLAA
jgi:hypothetical protein